jgi:hypothetical protein
MKFFNPIIYFIILLFFILLSESPFELYNSDLLLAAAFGTHGNTLGSLRKLKLPSHYLSFILGLFLANVASLRSRKGCAPQLHINMPKNLINVMHHICKELNLILSINLIKGIVNEWYSVRKMVYWEITSFLEPLLPRKTRRIIRITI